METRYTYSLNSSDWTGEFKTRKDARAAAIDAAYRLPETPGVVYVGKIIPADTQTSRHAQTVIKEMNDRAKSAGISNYLSNLKPDQIRDLDQALTQTLDSWLTRQHLGSAQFSVQAISEYPVPAAASVHQSTEKEIGDLGPPTSRLAAFLIFANTPTISHAASAALIPLRLCGPRVRAHACFSVFVANTPKITGKENSNPTFRSPAAQ